MMFRTDLAVEEARSYEGRLPEGISVTEKEEGGLVISTVEVTSATGSSALGKPMGKYVTVIAPPFSGAREIDNHEMTAIATQISSFLPEDGLVLVVGLGNNDITPDAIGPRTAHQILATRHFSPEVSIEAGLGNLRPCAAIAPGVLGQTGIETSEIIKAIANDIKPAVIIVVDALAAKDAGRLGNTIQISNVGISPGSGVQNRRKELSQATLGVPVISIGVPTVVDAATLASDLLKNEDELDSCRELFEANGATMMITPREIDVLIGHACKILAMSINMAVHPEMTLDEIGYLVS